MRHLILATLLLALAMPTSAAKTGADVLVELDVQDAVDDSRAFPDVRLPQTDIVRFTTHLDGADVVQTVHVVGPWPANDFWVEIRNDFGFSEWYSMKVERMNSSGSNVRPTDYNTSRPTRRSTRRRPASASISRTRATKPPSPSGGPPPRSPRTPSVLDRT